MFGCLFVGQLFVRSFYVLLFTVWPNVLFQWCILLAGIIAAVSCSYGENIVSIADADMHRRHRKVVEPAFQEKNLRELVNISNRSTDLLIKRLEKKMKLEVASDFIDVTMDVIGKSNFGVNLNVFHESDTNAKHSLFDKTKHLKSFYDALETTATAGLALQMFVPKWLHSLPLFRSITVGGINETRQYIKELIAARSSSSEASGADLLSLLLESNENGEEENKLTEEELIADSFVFLFAGHETSATNLGHLFVELAKNQHVQDKCIEEIDRVLSGQDFTYDHFNALPYCMNCIKESLRRHSAVEVIPKTPKANLNLCGYNIPKNSFLWIDIYRTHLNSENWKDPFTFNPDRFNEKYDPLAYLPFSFGTRKCVGFQFSYVETLAILVRLLQKYRFELEAGKDPKTYYPELAPIVTVKIKREELVMKKR